MNPNPLEKRALLAFALLYGLSLSAAGSLAAQESTFDWQPTNDESARMDPADYHTGRTFRSGDQAGNVHVDIEAQELVTVEMAPAEEWSEAMRHPELLPRITFRCIREHITRTTYVCDVPRGRALTLVIHDERSSDRTSVIGYATPLTENATVRDFISPSDILVQYYRWACVENCSPPRYQWISELKETYDLTSAPKVYDGIKAERDGEPFSVKVNSPVPMMVAILPSGKAEALRQKADDLGPALQGQPCMEKSLRSATFECTFDLADGPQSLIAVPEAGNKVPASKKAEVEVAASKCVANCLTDIEK